ncbi:hypothetical protein LWE81_18475, partial [Clostridioides difficile]|nr:hypothetical protein [Clostridioides difficile]MCE0731158.1 hypothetical protein [Clostridioides difficile]
MKNKKIMLVLSILSISIFAVGCTNAQNGNDTSKKETKSNTNVEQPKEENSTEKEVPNNKTKPTPKEETKTQSATIYSFDVDKTDLIENKVDLSKIDENTLFEELQKLKVVPESAKLNS